MKTDTSAIKVAPALTLSLENMREGLKAIIADVEAIHTTTTDADTRYGLAGVYAAAHTILEALELQDRRYLAG